MKTRQSHPLSSNLLKIAIQQRAILQYGTFSVRHSQTEKKISLGECRCQSYYDSPRMHTKRHSQTKLTVSK